MTIRLQPGVGKLAAGALALSLAGCATAPPPVLAPCTTPQGPVAWLADHGWHTEVALPIAALRGPLAGLAAQFPGAGFLSFGYGQKRFVLAREGDPLKWLLGPLPGDGVLQVTGLTRADGLAIPLPPGGAERLSAYLWETLAKDAAGEPAAPQPLQSRLYYDTARRYTLGFTCNTWVAAALRAAGLPVHDAGVVWAGDVTAQARALPGACAPG